MNRTEKDRGWEIKIGEYRPGRGYEVCVAKCQATEFESFLAKLSPEERNHYGPMRRVAHRSDGSGVFVLGCSCAREEIIDLCSRFHIHA
jgi:hypothetical protein